MPEDAREQRIQSAMAFDGGISVPPPPATRFGMSDPDQIAWVERFMTPQPFGAEKTGLPLANPIGNGRPTTFVHCRSEEHTSELQSLMRRSYAVFCLKKK